MPVGGPPGPYVPTVIRFRGVRLTLDFRGAGAWTEAARYALANEFETNMRKMQGFAEPFFPALKEG